MSIYAVDFDGVICEDQYPQIGTPNKAVIQRLKKLKEDGHKLILWTCREDSKLTDAIEFCQKHGLYFDAYNANLLEVMYKYGTNPRKIGADYYIDDKNLILQEMERSEPPKKEEPPTEFPYEHAAMRDEELPPNLDLTDIKAYMALRQLYKQYRQGSLSKERAKYEKSQLIRAYSTDKHQDRLYKYTNGIWARINLTARQYTFEPTAQHADAFYAAVYGLPADWRRKIADKKMRDMAWKNGLEWLDQFE